MTQKFKVELKKQEDFDFVRSCKAEILQRKTPLAKVVLFSLIGFIVIFFVWASLADIEQVARGQGKVVPISHVQVIQNLEGGIVSEILVDEGARVKRGDILLKLDETIAKALAKEMEKRVGALKIAAARLEAEAYDLEEIAFPEEVMQNTAQILREIALFHSRRKTYDDALMNLQSAYALLNQEIDITEPLVEEGVISQIELLRLQRQRVDIKRRIEALQDETKRDILAELAEKKAQIAVFSERLKAIEDRMQRTTIRSPIDGIVKQIYVNTIGGVVGPAKPIMEIVPLEDRLQIEVMILPQDIAFVHPGQDAVVKITAYDFAIYGGLDGKVVHVSADTSTDRQGMSFDEVRIETEKNYLGEREGKFQIIPGMTASVDIITDKKSVLSYILKPILRAKEKALRES